MEEDKNVALKTRSAAQFKKKGANKKGKGRSISHEHSENSQIPNPSDTVYRILCPSRRIGSVIGKGGSRIKALREETMAKVSVSESVPGSDERVVMVFSPPNSNPKKESEEGNKEDLMPPHCPAQDALLKVHERIIEDDMIGRKEEENDENDDDDDNNFVLIIRLLVPHNMVGCLLGKGGDVIRRLRDETGASIRVLPYEHLPPCALSTDELVQIQGKPSVLKKALYEVSTLLHQNPRKEKALNFAMPARGPAFHPAGPPMPNMPPPRARNPMWSPHDPSSHMPPPPWRDDFGSHRGFMPGGFDDGVGRPGVEPSGEFSMKILCLDSKIGGVIGKGGMNVRQLEQETGSNIHVEEASESSEERVIRVSAFETLRNPRSQTIDALLLLQNKVGQASEKGTLTTRLLIPSSKVGCLLGQGGSIINEMRRRTLADIRLCKKEEKPKCASEDEELVQVSGSFAVAKEALGEIASRLRARSLKDGNAGGEPAPPRPVQGYGAGGGFPRGPPLPGSVGVGPPGGYHAVKDYEPPVHSGASGYLNPNSSAEAHYPNSKISPIPGAGGGIYSNAPEAPGMRMPYHGGSEPKVDMHGAPNQYNAPPNMAYNYSGQNSYQQPPYPNPNPNGQVAYQTMAQPHPPYSDPSAQGTYHSMAPQQAYPDPSQNPSGQVAYPTTYANPDPNANLNGQNAYFSQQVAYQGTYQNAHQVPYDHNSAQQSDPNSDFIRAFLYHKPENVAEQQP